MISFKLDFTLFSSEIWRAIYLFLKHFLFNYQNTRNLPTWAIISCFILIYNSNCFILLMMPIVVWEAFVLIQWLLAYLATLSLYVVLYYCATEWLLL